MGKKGIEKGLRGVHFFFKSFLGKPYVHELIVFWDNVPQMLRIGNKQCSCDISNLDNYSFCSVAMVSFIPNIRLQLADRILPMMR